MGHERHHEPAHRGGRLAHDHDSATIEPISDRARQRPEEADHGPREQHRRRDPCRGPRLLVDREGECGSGRERPGHRDHAPECKAPDRGSGSSHDPSPIVLADLDYPHAESTHLATPVVMTEELVVREARAGDARAIAEVSVASRRWSYLNLVADADLKALSVERKPPPTSPKGSPSFLPVRRSSSRELTGRVRLCHARGPHGARHPAPHAFEGIGRDRGRKWYRPGVPIAPVGP
jgi:hypothetical protein